MFSWIAENWYIAIPVLLVAMPAIVVLLKKGIGKYVAWTDNKWDDKLWAKIEEANLIDQVAAKVIAYLESKKNNKLG